MQDKMTGAEVLERIEDKASVENIRELTKRVCKQSSPLKIVLFGSFVKGSYTEVSDYDFYLVVDDDESVAEETKKPIIHK